MNTSNSPTTGAGAAKNPADPVLGEARRAAGDVAAEAKTLAKDAQAKMAELADDATQQARSFAETNKSRIAEQAAAFSGALGKAAAELEQSDQGTMARYARDVAHGIDDMSTALRERGVDELMQTVQDFARRQPAAFLGAAALAGFAAGRFAKASARRPAGTQTGAGNAGDTDFGAAGSWRGTGHYAQTERGH